MNTDKPQLLIVEDDNDFIQIWKDYFSQRYKINFIKVIQIQDLIIKITLLYLMQTLI